MLTARVSPDSTDLRAKFPIRLSSFQMPAASLGVSRPPTLLSGYKFRDPHEPPRFNNLREWLTEQSKALYLQLQFIIKDTNQDQPMNRHLRQDLGGSQTHFPCPFPTESWHITTHTHTSMCPPTRKLTKASVPRVFITVSLCSYHWPHGWTQSLTPLSIQEADITWLKAPTL